MSKRIRKGVSYEKVISCSPYGNFQVFKQSKLQVKWKRIDLKTLPNNPGSYKTNEELESRFLNKKHLARIHKNVVTSFYKARVNELRLFGDIALNLLDRLSNISYEDCSENIVVSETV